MLVPYSCLTFRCFCPGTGEAWPSCAVSLKCLCVGLPFCQARRFTLVDGLFVEINFATCPSRCFSLAEVSFKGRMSATLFAVNGKKGSWGQVLRAVKGNS